MTDSPYVTQRNDELRKIQMIIEAEPGLSQNAIWKKSGMMKSRFVKLLKEGAGTLWKTKSGEKNCICYFPVVLDDAKSLFSEEGTADNNRTKGSCSVVLSPLGENSRTAPSSPAERPNGKSISSCTVCGSFAIYRECQWGRCLHDLLEWTCCDSCVTSAHAGWLG